MDTIDFKKDITYKAKTTPEIINVPKMLFVMVDGKGGPESSDKSDTEFQQAMQAIFGIVYTIKFWDKKYAPPKGYSKFTMAPIEALWWSGNNQEFDMNGVAVKFHFSNNRLPEIKIGISRLKKLSRNRLVRLFDTVLIFDLAKHIFALVRS